VLDHTGNTIRVEVETFQGRLAERYLQAREQLRRALRRASDAAATFATAMDRLAEDFDGIAAEERDIALAQLHPSPRDIPTDERLAALRAEFHTAQTRARTAIRELNTAAPTTTSLFTTPTTAPAAAHPTATHTSGAHTSGAQSCPVPGLMETVKPGGVCGDGGAEEVSR
jgi:ABC-type transporter Mla subunit MlaD